MALIKCVECGGTVSDKASVCPHCGAPILKCKECGEVLPQGAETCSNCGSPCEQVFEEVKPPVPKKKVRPDNNRGGFSNRKVILIAVAVVLLFLIATCPNAKQHKQVINDRISMAVEEIHDSLTASNGFGLSDVVIDEVTKKIIENQFSLDNYWLFSVGKVHWNHQSQMVTFGIVHHVFCFISKDQIKDAIIQWQQSKKKSVNNFFSIIKSLFGIGDDHVDAPDLSGDDGSVDASPDNSSQDENLPDVSEKDSETNSI